jgi:hypothetical protein
VREFGLTDTMQIAADQINASRVLPTPPATLLAN